MQLRRPANDRTRTEAGIVGPDGGEIVDPPLLGLAPDGTDHIDRVVQPIGRADGQVDIAVAEAGDGLRAFGHALEVPVDLDRDGRFEVGMGEHHLADPGKGPAVDPYRGRRASLQLPEAIGTATGQERVYKYVSILAVAVSLKKKNR